MPQVEVCFSPSLFGSLNIEDGFVTVVVDVLRATSAFCAAFDAGVDSLVPVVTLEQLKVLKNSGFITAAERDGKKVDFAEFGNSPTLFLQADLKHKSLAYSTTNGTAAIELARNKGAIITASFANLDMATSWILNEKKNVVLLCSGWKNTFSLEDTVCAGAIVEKILLSGDFSSNSDSVFTALRLWNEARSNPQKYCSDGSHYKRLLALGLTEDLNHCFRLNSSKMVPVWDGEKFVRASI